VAIGVPGRSLGGNASSMADSAQLKVSIGSVSISREPDLDGGKPTLSE